MLVDLAAADRRVVLGSLVAVLTTGGTVAITEAGSASVAAFGHHALGDPDPAVADLALSTPAQLAAALDGAESVGLVAQALAISALVDGHLDADRIDVVLDFVGALGVDDHWVGDLAMSRSADLAPVIADMGQRNLESVTVGRVDLGGIDDISAWLLPYDGDGADPALSARYRELGALDEASFGRRFFDFYDRHGFALPGEPGAVNEVFSTPHDATHLLSGYDTSPQGELLVSTFTSQMHPLHPFEGHVLPVIYSWHLGIEFNRLAGSYRGALEPAKLWVAWERGGTARFDTFAPDFDFWEHVEQPLADVAAHFGIPELHADFAAASDAVAGVDYHPIA